MAESTMSMTVTSGTAVEALLGSLEKLLRELVVHYENLTKLADERVEAIRAASTSRLSACIERENRIIQSVAEIEKRRLAVVGELADRLGGGATHGPQAGGRRSAKRAPEVKVSWIAERVAEPWRARLSALAQRLRELLSTVMQKNERSKVAAEMLGQHMEGLIRQVAARLNHAKTYGRGGKVETGARVVSAVDIRS